MVNKIDSFDNYIRDIEFFSEHSKCYAFGVPNLPSKPVNSVKLVNLKPKTEQKIDSFDRIDNLQVEGGGSQSIVSAFLRFLKNCKNLSNLSTK